MTETTEENISIKTIGSFTIYEALTPDEGNATEKILNINGVVEVFDIVFNREEATHIFINSHTEEKIVKKLLTIGEKLIKIS